MPHFGILSVAVVLALCSSPANCQDSEEGRTLVDWYFYDVGNTPEGKVTSIPLRAHRRTSPRAQWQDFQPYLRAPRPGDECFHHTMESLGLCMPLEQCQWAQREVRVSGQTQVCDPHQPGLVCCPSEADKIHYPQQHNGLPYELVPQPPCLCGQGQGKPPGQHPGGQGQGHYHPVPPGPNHEQYPHGSPTGQGKPPGNYYPVAPGSHSEQYPLGSPSGQGKPPGHYHPAPPGSHSEQHPNGPPLGQEKPPGHYFPVPPGSHQSGQHPNGPSIGQGKPPGHYFPVPPGSHSEQHPNGPSVGQGKPPGHYFPVAPGSHSEQHPNGPSIGQGKPPGHYFPVPPGSHSEQYPHGFPAGQGHGKPPSYYYPVAPGSHAEQYPQGFPSGQGKPPGHYHPVPPGSHSEQYPHGFPAGQGQGKPHGQYYPVPVGSYSEQNPHGNPEGHGQGGPPGQYYPVPAGQHPGQNEAENSFGQNPMPGGPSGHKEVVHNVLGKPPAPESVKDKDTSYVDYPKEPKPATSNSSLNGEAYRPPPVVSGIQDKIDNTFIDPQKPSPDSDADTKRKRGAVARKMCVEYERYAPKFRFGSDKDCIPNHTYPIGGNPALPTEFPHMAQLGVGRRDSIQYFCGGSLIAPTWVLTAAHCVYREDRPVQWVRLGDLVPDSDSDDSFPQIIEVLERVTHPDYSPRLVYNDVALLRLRHAPNMTTPHVRPACLQVEKELEKDKLNLIGFGLTEENGFPAKELMEVALWRTPFEKCEKFFVGEVNLRQLPRGLDDESQLCAGLDQVGKDACQGDSGGPLNTPYSPTCMHNVAGITSFGQGCGRGKPGVYTRVSHFVPWIESIVWPDQL